MTRRSLDLRPEQAGADRDSKLGSSWNCFVLGFCSSVVLRGVHSSQQLGVHRLAALNDSLQIATPTSPVLAVGLFSLPKPSGAPTTAGRDRPRSASRPPRRSRTPSGPSWPPRTAWGRQEKWRCRYKDGDVDIGVDIDIDVDADVDMEFDMDIDMTSGYQLFLFWDSLCHGAVGPACGILFCSGLRDDEGIRILESGSKVQEKGAIVSRSFMFLWSYGPLQLLSTSRVAGLT